MSKDIETGGGAITAMRKALSMTAVALVTAATGTASAQVMDPMEPGAPEKPPLESKVADVGNGLAVARKLCTTCHLIGEPNEGPSPADVPTFASIANRPNQSPEGLTNWLMAPHQPMPDPHLTRIEIRDLTGYILSLKRP